MSDNDIQSYNQPEDSEEDREKKSELQGESSENLNSPKNNSVLLVKFVHSNETQICSNPLKEGFEKGDHVVVPSRYGKDLAYVLGTITQVHNYDMKEAEEVVRRASQQDIDAYERNLEKEAEALELCREKVKKHKLDMKLVAAH